MCNVLTGQHDLVDAGIVLQSHLVLTPTRQRSIVLENEEGSSQRCVCVDFFRLNLTCGFKWRLSLSLCFPISSRYAEKSLNNKTQMVCVFLHITSQLVSAVFHKIAISFSSNSAKLTSTQSKFLGTTSGRIFRSDKNTLVNNAHLNGLP